MFCMENIIDEIEAPKEFLDIIKAAQVGSTLTNNVDLNNNAVNQTEIDKENLSVQLKPKTPIKRKLNASFESKENNPNNSVVKKPKREPFKNITNATNIEIEVAKSLVELSTMKNVNKNESLNDTLNKNTLSLKMTCESDESTEVVTVTSKKERIPFSSLPIKKTTVKEKYDVLNPQILSSTPLKCSNETPIDEDILNICHEANIEILENNKSTTIASANNLNTTFEEIESSVNTNNVTTINIENTTQVDSGYKFENEFENEPVDNKKLKIKMNFKQKIKDLPKKSEETSKETKQKRKLESPETAFAVNFILNTFTEEEIRNGAFADSKNKLKSKNKVALTTERVNEIKRAISNKFNMNEKQLDELWEELRPKLNARLRMLVKRKKFQKRFEAINSIN